MAAKNPPNLCNFSLTSKSPFKAGKQFVVLAAAVTLFFPETFLLS
jgi:hypothetical protein